MGRTLCRYRALIAKMLWKREALAGNGLYITGVTTKGKLFILGASSLSR